MSLEAGAYGAVNTSSRVIRNSLPFSLQMLVSKCSTNKFTTPTCYRHIYIYHIASLEKTGYNVCKNRPRSLKKSLKNLQRNAMKNLTLRSESSTCFVK